MKTLFVRVLAFIAVTSGIWMSSPAHALTKQDIINSYAAKTPDEVLATLMGPGIGACYVGDGDSCPSCACHYYLNGGVTTPNNYTGAPVYNSDNWRPSGYNMSGVATARVAQVAGKPKDSTGCFAGAGGLKSGSNTVWQGNNSDEGGLSPAAYAKKVVLRMMADAADPCKLNAMVSALQSATNGFSTEAAVQDTTTTYVFSNATGVMNPKDCRRKIILTGALSPAGSISETACAVIYSRMLARNQTPQPITAGAGILRSSNSPEYRNALQSARSALLNSYAAANPAAFDPEAPEQPLSSAAPRLSQSAAESASSSQPSSGSQ